MIPTVTVDQMREVDRLMIEDMGIILLQMMENAGRALATQARKMLGGDVLGQRIVVLAGRGGNGGGGLAAARRLFTWGADVTVILGQELEDLQSVPAHQLAILRNIGVPVRDPRHAGPDDAILPSADLILDALIGYSLRGAPREPIASLIRAANAAGPPVLALDIPSGLDGDAGTAADPTIQAAATLTLALPKAGLVQPTAHAWLGELYVADISVPEAVYQRLGLRVGPIFARSDIVRAADGAPGMQT
jgi:NAD(P)H-hydrate epimerase